MAAAPGEETVGQEPAVAEWTDSHCHLQDGYLDVAALGGVIERAKSAGVDRLVCIGTDLATSKRAAELAAGLAAGHVGEPTRPYEAWATVGLHPHEASEGTGPIEELLATLLGETAPGGPGPGSPRPPGSIVGIGECGLDYYYDHSPRPAQRRAFEEQIGLAKELGLTLVVHTRDAWEDTLAILSGAGLPERTIIHCFTGGPSEAASCLELGAYLSFSGIVTFKSAEEVREAAKLCPADRLLVETDAPFLAPVPHRGKQNEPALVAVVGRALAALRGVDPAALAASSSAAATEAYRLA